jgi:hypothetical protein
VSGNAHKPKLERSKKGGINVTAFTTVAESNIKTEGYRAGQVLRAR